MANSRTDLALEKFARVKSIMDENLRIKRDLPKRYVRTIAQIINCQIDLSKHNDALSMIKDLKSLGSLREFSSIDIKNNIFKSSALAELQLLNKQGDFNEASERLLVILPEIEILENRLRKEQLLELYFTVAYTFFGSKEPNKALFWINKVLNDNESSLRKDLFSYARLFNLAIHYELENFDLLEYITKSTQRYLARRQRDYDLEKLVIEHVRKLIRTNDATKLKAKLQKFQSVLTSQIVEPEDKILLKYFDFISWLDSKIKACDFSDSVRAVSA